MLHSLSYHLHSLINNLKSYLSVFKTSYFPSFHVPCCYQACISTKFLQADKSWRGAAPPLSPTGGTSEDTNPLASNCDQKEQDLNSWFQLCNLRTTFILVLLKEAVAGLNARDQTKWYLSHVLNSGCVEGRSLWF